MLVRGGFYAGICHRLKSKLLRSSIYCRPLCSTTSQSSTVVVDERDGPDLEFTQLRPSEAFYKSQSEEDRIRLDEVIQKVAALGFTSKRLPQSSLRDRDWTSMMRCKTDWCIKNQLGFVRARKKDEDTERRLKEARKSPAALEKRRRIAEDDREKLARGELVYSLSKNNMLLRATRRRMNCELYLRMASMMRLETTPTVLIDCGFLPLQSDKEVNGTAVQIQHLLSDNLRSVEPWNVGLVNLDPSAPRMKEYIDLFLRHYMGGSDFEIEKEGEPSVVYPRIDPLVSEKSYLDLFDRDRLVYLSPDADEELETIDNDSIYIMGAIVDVDWQNRVGVMPKRASWKKAKEDGVRCVKLPLDKYIKWQTGHMLLPFNVVVKIMMDVHLSRGDWRYALLKNISKRNLVPIEERNQATRRFYGQFRSDRKDSTGSTVNQADKNDEGDKETQSDKEKQAHG